MDTKSHYKLVSTIEPLGTIINTEDRVDLARIARFSELKYLLSLIFKVSYQNNISICYILSQIYSGFVCPQNTIMGTVSFAKQITEIKNEIDRTNFRLQIEFRYFNDFVLNEVRNELDRKNLILPDRFKSHYFFDSLKQCFDYHSNLPPLTPCKIIEVEFVNLKQTARLDNMFLTHFEETFTAKDFLWTSQKNACQGLLHMIQYSK